MDHLKLAEAFEVAARALRVEDRHSRGSTGAALRISYTPLEASKVTGISLDTIRVAYRSGELVAHYRTPKRPVILRADLIAWIEAAPTERREPLSSELRGSTQTPTASVSEPGELRSFLEAAAYLNVSESWLRKKVAARQIPHTRLGRNVRFSDDDLDRIVTMNRVEPTSHVLVGSRRPRR